MDTPQDEFLALVGSPGAPSYRFVHLATHAVVDTEFPDLSVLVFSPSNGADEDPHLDLLDLTPGCLPCEMAVLSACESGLGALIPGEGVVGLARGMVVAGAQSVCVSLWQVDDHSTSMLMSGFYRRVGEGVPKATALRQAQLDLAGGKWAHPFFWGAFMVSGE